MAKLDQEVQKAAEKKPSQEVAEQKVPRAGLNLLIDEVQRIRDQAPDDELAVMDRIVMNILNPDITPDALEIPTPLKAADVVGESLTVHGIEFTESDIEESPVPFYASLHVSRARGQGMAVVNCGGVQLVAQAVRLWHDNEWPKVVKIDQVGKEKAGRTRTYVLKYPQAADGAPY